MHQPTEIGSPSDGESASLPPGELPSASDTSGDSELTQLDLQIRELRERSGRYSLVRLALFVLLVIGIFAGLQSLAYLAFLAAPALLAFFVVIARHGGVQDRLRALERRRLLHVEREDRIANRPRERRLPTVAAQSTPLERGERIYRDEARSWKLDDGVIDDLQLLGTPRGLFAFLDVSSSIFGAARLRHWISHPLRDIEEIRRRQDAVREAAENDPRRERLLSTLCVLRETSLDAIPRSLYEPPTLDGRRALGIVAHILGTLPILLLIACFFSSLAFGLLILAIIVNLSVIGANVKRTNPARDRLIQFGPVLRGLHDLDAALETDALSSEMWREIDAELDALAPASAKLRRSIGLLELHSFGVIFEVINALLLWELRILPAAESLFETYRERIERAIGALGEVEAILSAACPLAEQQGYSMPTVQDGDEPSIHAQRLGHPLIDSRVVVHNDLQIGSVRSELLPEGETPPRILILTGSNMAGKSTYLRSCGCNLVLAGMGGPVCAETFEWTPLALMSDINVRDSLDDGKSYFQVEVERVHETIRAAQASPMLLAIFDELFRGTNADERIALARSILRFLRDSGALLIVATHDNALTWLVSKENEPAMANFHLREEVVGREMTFDYKVRPGPATTRNAIRVLEVSDYPEEITRRAREDLGE